MIKTQLTARTRNGEARSILILSCNDFLAVHPFNLLFHGLLQLLIVEFHDLLDLLRRDNDVLKARNPHLSLFFTRGVQFKLPKRCFHEERVDVLAAIRKFLQSRIGCSLRLEYLEDLSEKDIFDFLIVLAVLAVVINFSVFDWLDLKHRRDEVQRKVPLRVARSQEYFRLLSPFAKLTLHNEISKRTVVQRVVVPFPESHVSILDELVVLRVLAKLLV